MLDGVDPPPPSPPDGREGAAVAEAEAPQDVTEVGDEVIRPHAWLEAMQAVIAELEREAAAARVSHTEAQARLLGRC